jgi:hypothetical protein
MAGIGGIFKNAGDFISPKKGEKYISFDNMGCSVFITDSPLAFIQELATLPERTLLKVGIQEAASTDMYYFVKLTPQVIEEINL